MNDPLRDADFVPHVGRQFRFPGWGSALRLAAVEVQPRSSMPGSARVPFTLVFHGPAGDVLPEGLYRAEIADGPAVELYVMPIHTVAAGRQEYQAVFN